MTETIRQLLERAYLDGWCAAAHWAQRDDLEADVGSPAYVKERDDALEELINPPAPPGVPVDPLTSTFCEDE